MITCVVALILVLSIILIFFKLVFRLDILLIDDLKCVIKFNAKLNKFKVYSIKKEIVIIDKLTSINRKIGNNTISRIVNALSKSKWDINIDVGLENSLIPIYTIPIFSTVISEYLVYNVNGKNIKNIQYKLNGNCMSTHVHINVKLITSLITIYRIIYILLKERVSNGRKSSRKVNVSCNE